MAIDQQLIFLCPPNQLPSLLKEGWRFQSPPTFPLSASEFKTILSQNKFVPQKSWDDSLFIYTSNDIEISIFEKNDIDAIQEIQIRLSLLQHVSGAASQFQTSSDLQKLSQKIQLLAEQSGLKIFDPMQTRLIEGAEELFRALCLSKIGKHYHYDQYLI